MSESVTLIENPDDSVIQRVKPLKPFLEDLRRNLSFDKEILTNPSEIKSEIISKLSEQACITKIKTGAGFIASLCLTDDEKFAIVSAGNNMLIIDLQQRTVAHTFENAHEQKIQRILITNDSKTLISCGQDGSIKFWDFNTRQLLHKIDKAHEKWVSTMFLSKDNKYLISGSSDLVVWNMETKTSIGTIPSAHKFMVQAVTCTQNNKYIISSSAGRDIKVWNLETLAPVHCFDQAHLGNVLNVRVLSDDQTLISSSQDGSFALWDLTRREHIHTFLNAHSGAIWGIMPMFQDEYLITASQDCTINIWSLQNRALVHSFQGLKEIFYKLAITNDNRYIYVTGAKGNFYIIDLESQEDSIFIKDAHNKIIDDIKLTEDEKYLISGADDGRLCIWDFSTKELVKTFEKPAPTEFWTLTLSPDNPDIFASGCSDGSLDLWSLKTLEHLKTCEQKHPKGVVSCAFHGNKIISCHHAPSMTIRDTEKLSTVKTLQNIRTSSISRLAVTNDQKYLISGSSDGDISFWSLETMKRVYLIEHAHDSWLWILKLIKNNQYIITTGVQDNKIKVWDFPNQKHYYTFHTSHKTTIRSLALTKDDDFILSCDNDCHIEIHSLKFKQRVFNFSGLMGEKAIPSLFTADSSHILIGRNTSIHRLNICLNQLDVQYDNGECIFSRLRFMPLINFLKSSNSEQQLKMIESYPGMIILPYGWNWFHVVTIFAPNKVLLSACLDKRIPFVTDLHNKTPLHYLFENENTDLSSLNFLLSRFDVILESSQIPLEILSSLSPIFKNILLLDSAQTVSFLNLCIREPEAKADEIVDVYGEIKGSYHGRAFCCSQTPYYHNQIREKLILSNPKQKIAINLIPFAWNYSLSSHDIRNLVRSLLKVKNPQIFETKIVTNLIEYLWKSSRNFFYIVGFLFSVYAVLVSVYTGLGDRNLGLEIAIFVFSIVFLLYEFFEAKAGGFHEYFLSIWNYLDALGGALVPATIIAVWCGKDEEVRSWLFAFVLAYIYARWLSFFRMFSQTRRLMRMIIEIILDIRSFALVLAFITFGLSLIFLQFDREMPYNTHLLNAYNLLYSNYEVVDSTGNTFFLLITIALVCIVLLNMLIAIMGEAFSRVQEMSGIVDSKELLVLVLERVNIGRNLNILRSRQRVHEISEQKSYMFFAEERVEEEVGEQEKIESYIVDIKKQLNVNNIQIASIQNTLNKQGEMLAKLMQQFEDGKVKKD